MKITNLSTATFFRLVSAYQDKLIDKKSWRVGSFKRILDAMKDHFGGVNFNAFAQVILYASETSCRKMNRCTLNVHWKPYIRKEQYCFEVILYLVLYFRTILSLWVKIYHKPRNPDIIFLHRESLWRDKLRYKIGIHLLQTQLSPDDQACMELSQLSALAVCNWCISSTW